MEPPASFVDRDHTIEPKNAVTYPRLFSTYPFSSRQPRVERVTSNLHWPEGIPKYCSAPSVEVSRRFGVCADDDGVLSITDSWYL